MRAIDVEEAMRFLRVAGKRVTGERKLLLRLISEHPHLDASELYRVAKEENPKISLSTVYRTVNLLEELGLVEASGLGEDHDHYEIRLGKHYHFVCLDCGKVIELPPVDLVKELGEKRGFEVVGVKVELVGYCEKCRNKRVRKGDGLFPDAGAKKVGRGARMIDLREVPVLEHPSRVSREVERLREGEALEILTNDPGRLTLAPKMLGQVAGIELVSLWREGRLCHALVRKLVDG